MVWDVIIESINVMQNALRWPLLARILIRIPSSGIMVRLLVKKSFHKKSDSRGPGFLKRLSVGTPIS